jgi:hypothetical protein
MVEQCWSQPLLQRYAADAKGMHLAFNATAGLLV